MGDHPYSWAELEIVRTDKTISGDIKEVLERWHLNILNLFSGLSETPKMAFNEVFF